MKHYIIYILFLLAATSCGLSEDPEAIEEGREVELSFSLEIPEALNENVGLKAYDENSVRCIDLLVFDQANKFLQRIKVNSISGTGATKTFSVRIAATTQARTFHIVANGRDENSADLVNFSSITINTLESVAIPSLKTNTLAANTSPALPVVMWGRAALTSVASGSSLGTIKMLRTVASMYTQCATATASNGMSDFSLTAFTVLKSSNVGKVAPNSYTVEAATPTTVSLIGGSAYIDYVLPSGTGVWANATSNKTSELYMYERTNELTNNGLSVIIRGKYKGVDGYYKVWLANASGQVLHIVRNHRYLIQITKVSGTGYATLQEAMNATYSANIFAEIVDENNEITDMVVDGKNELGVSSGITISGSGLKAVGTVLNTNTAATLTASSDVAWITSITFTGSGNFRTVTATFGATAAARTGTITFRAGSLTRTIVVTQNP
ncbi:hypothetical protein [Dysgonomonas sp. ZJ279]|uniref:hypothetical protein n=1 Tax=Dysgonomonas sp. ZJ279 TaxID=2709796 RepID=UPI0013EA1830|nr:hypothetical protein [Dysgonomonas sp. ZJ279]